VTGCYEKGNEHPDIKKKGDRCHDAISHCLSTKIIILLAGTSQTKRILMKHIVVGPTEVTGDWKRLHKEELHALYCSPSIIQVIRSRKMTCGRLEAHVGRGEVHTGFW
jgi:hypothetical protein